MQQGNTIALNTPAFRRLACLLLFAVFFLLSSGCGWRLRGSYEFPPSMARVYVEGTARFSELGIAIHSAFEGTNASLVTGADQATAILYILADKTEQRILATDSSGRASEYEISSRLRFRLTDVAGTQLIPEQVVTSKREYSFDPANVLATGGEVERLQQDMVRINVQQMMRRINAGLVSAE